MKTTPPGKKPVRRRRPRNHALLVALRIGVALAIVVIACFIAGVFVIRSGWFQEKVRERIIAEIEKSGGARVEMGSFLFDWEHLMATVSPLVIHGTEPAGEAPLFKADAVSLGLRVISMMERKIDLAWLRIERPAVRIVFYADGSNNLPGPRDRNPWTEDLLNFAVRRYDVDNGVLVYDGRAIPLTVHGERLRIGMSYERRGPLYRGELSTRTRIVARGVPPFEVETSAAFVLQKSRIEISRLHVATQNSHADLSGVLIEPRAPHGNLSLTSAISVKEAVEIFGLPVAPTGSAAFDGRMIVGFARPMDFEMNGRLTARGLGYTRGQVQINGAEFRADVRMDRHQFELSDISLAAQGATVTGRAVLSDWRQFHFGGDLGGVNLRTAARMASGKSIPWDGTVSGEFSIDATLPERSAKAQAALEITPAPQGAALAGRINASYDQSSGELLLADSRVSTAATEVEASGVVGRTLRVRAQSKNLDDLLPVLALASENAPKELPLKLAHGEASFQGTLTGPLNNPAASGNLTISSASVQGHAFDRFSGEIRADRNSVRIEKAMLARGATVIEGSAEKTGDAIAAQVSIRGAQLSEIVKEAGSSFEISGTASGTAQVSGSLKRPQAEISAEILNLAAFGEQLDRVRAKVHYSPEQMDVSAGEAEEGAAKATFTGAFSHPPDDWRNGEIRFTVATPGVSLAQIKTLVKLQPSLSARVDGTASGTLRLIKGAPEIASISGRANAHSVAWDRQPLGDISASAETHGADLAVRANAQVRDIRIDAQGSWRLQGDDPGSATLRISRASVASVSNVVLAGGPLEGSVPPFDGFIEGASASVSVALRKPLDFRAELTIPVFRISPQPKQTLRLGVQAQELVVENSEPVVIGITSREARVRSAEFKARDTNIEANGAVSFDAKTPSDLGVRGSINLIILQLLNPDLVARGSAAVQASVRGSLKDPQISGRMELKRASLYLGDLPNGVDNVNGSVIFDRNRATIETLTAETGGGTLSLSGFLGFGTPLLYRLQAEAQKVRVRYPEDVSVTFNSNLALNGTSDASTVSGQITLMRASFTPRADISRVLAQVVRPVPTSATSSEYVRGMQFDVRILSDPSFELQTSLARNLQAAVDLRLRGTPLRPALLGTASVNEGEVEVYGNRYTVNRGDVRFVNPVRIDPVLDVDLETRARSVTVNIAIAGTLQKLGVNYSSDPPLQPREIIALLAVGRAPTGAGALNPEAASTDSSTLVQAGGGLIGQAISEQLSSRWQRFFGSSHVKIDPTVTGAEYLPQARLTIEQQVSKDVTLTYITNLNRTQEQIVQIEWDFSKKWSAVAVRDADGLFGVDFQYRKRFK